MEPITVAIIAVIIIAILYVFLTQREAREISARDALIEAANKMIEEYKVKISQIIADKEVAEKMVEEYKANVVKAVNEKLAADRIAAERKISADKAIAEKSVADKAAADYKVMMDKAIADKTASDKMVIDYKVISDNAKVAQASAEKALAELKTAAIAAAAKAVPFGTMRASTLPKQYTGVTTYNLEKMPVGCTNGALSKVQLMTDEATAWYNYGCSFGGNLGTKTNYMTPFDAGGAGGNIYLDRQGVQCPEGQVLTGFDYIKDPNSDQIRYTYMCAPAPGLTCRDVSTPAFSDGAGNFRFLERHNMECNSDEAIGGFRLRRPTPTEINYNYRCCKV